MAYLTIDVILDALEADLHNFFMLAFLPGGDERPGRKES